MQRFYNHKIIKIECDVKTNAFAFFLCSEPEKVNAIWIEY